MSIHPQERILTEIHFSVFMEVEILTWSRRMRSVTTFGCDIELEFVYRKFWEMHGIKKCRHRTIRGVCLSFFDC